MMTAEWIEATKPLDPMKDRDELHARNVAIFASSDAKPYVLRDDWRVVKPPKKLRERMVGSLVIHIAPRIGEPDPKPLCSVKRGRAAKDPTTTTLTVDRWCSNCWRAWAQPRLGAA